MYIVNLCLGQSKGILLSGCHETQMKTNSGRLKEEWHSLNNQLSKGNGSTIKTTSLGIFLPANVKHELRVTRHSGRLLAVEIRFRS